MKMVLVKIDTANLRILYAYVCVHKTAFKNPIAFNFSSSYTLFFLGGAQKMLLKYILF